MMRTTFMAKGHEVERKWFVVDAEGQTLGRLASEVAAILRGKNKPTFTPNVDTGDHVIPPAAMAAESDAPYTK